MGVECLGLGESVRNGSAVIEQVRIVSRDPAPPRIEYVQPSGGIFRDVMIRDIDQWRFLLNEDLGGAFVIETVLTDRAIADANDVDAATAVFRPAGGASQRCVYSFDRRVEIFEKKDRVALDNVSLTQTSAVDEAGSTTPPLPRHFPQGYRDTYRDHSVAFVHAISKRRIAPQVRIRWVYVSNCGSCRRAP